MMRSVNGTCVTVDASKYGVWWYQIPFICSIQSRKRWDTVQNKFVEFMCWMIKLLDGDGGVLKRPQYIRLCCNNARGYSTSDYAATSQGLFTLLIIWVMYNIPDFCVVQNSFFSVMYNIPDFSDVQYSCFLWCTIFLFSMMYNILIFCDVQYSCFPCSTLVWCMIIWCIQFLKLGRCT